MIFITGLAIWAIAYCVGYVAAKFMKQARLSKVKLSKMVIFFGVASVTFGIVGMFMVMYSLLHFAWTHLA